MWCGDVEAGQRTEHSQPLWAVLVEWQRGGTWLCCRGAQCWGRCQEQASNVLLAGWLMAMCALTLLQTRLQHACSICAQRRSLWQRDAGVCSSGRVIYGRMNRGWLFHVEGADGTADQTVDWRLSDPGSVVMIGQHGRHCVQLMAAGFRLAVRFSCACVQERCDASEQVDSQGSRGTCSLG